MSMQTDALVVRVRRFFAKPRSVPFPGGERGKRLASILRALILIVPFSVLLSGPISDIERDIQPYSSGALALIAGIAVIMFNAFLNIGRPRYDRPASRFRRVFFVFCLIFAAVLAAIFGALSFVLFVPISLIAAATLLNLGPPRYDQPGLRFRTVFFAFCLIFAAVVAADLYALNLVLLVAISLIAAATLEIGLAVGVWVVAIVFVLPHALHSCWEWSPFPLEQSIVPFTWLRLAGALSTLPLFLYVRSVRRSPTAFVKKSLVSALVTAGVFVGAAVFISLITGWSVANEVPRYIADAGLSQRRESTLRLKKDIERRFAPSQVSGANDRFATFIKERAEVLNSNVYVFTRLRRPASFKLAPPSKVTQAPILVVAGVTRFLESNRSFDPSSESPPDPPDARVREIYNWQAVPRADRLVVSGWLQRHGFLSDYWTGALDTWNDPLMRAMGGPPEAAILADESPVNKDGGWMPDIGEAAPNDVRRRFVVVITSNSRGWYEVANATTFMFGPIGRVFPLLFFSLLLLASLSLFLTSRREALRHQLVKAEERARINQEAHDRISNRLSALAIAAETQAGRQAQAQEFFGQLPGTLRRIVSDLKEVTSKSPGNAALPAAVFGSMLREACKNRAAEHNFDLRQNIRIDESLVIEFSVGEALILCLEEALGNVAKHAGARNVEVSVMCPKTGDCRMTVKDDGRGFAQPQDFSMLEAAGHSGLAGMTRRVNELGGVLMLESEPGKGTAVMISWR